MLSRVLLETWHVNCNKAFDFGPLGRCFNLNSSLFNKIVTFSCQLVFFYKKILYVLVLAFPQPLQAGLLLPLLSFIWYGHFSSDPLPLAVAMPMAERQSSKPWFSRSLFPFHCSSDSILIWACTYYIARSHLTWTVLSLVNHERALHISPPPFLRLSSRGVVAGTPSRPSATLGARSGRRTPALVATDTFHGAAESFQIVRLPCAAGLLEPMEGAQQPSLQSNADAGNSIVGDHRQGG